MAKSDKPRNKEYDLNSLIEESIDNARNDRRSAICLNTLVSQQLLEGKESHRDVGLAAAKYLETAQRSNEQLVKLIMILNKESSAKTGLTKEDKEGLYEMMKPKEELDGES